MLNPYYYNTLTLSIYKIDINYNLILYIKKYINILKIKMHFLFMTLLTVLHTVYGQDDGFIKPGTPGKPLSVHDEGSVAAQIYL